MERSRAVQYRVGPKRRQKKRDKPKGNAWGESEERDGKIELAEWQQDQEITELARRERVAEGRE